MKLSGRGEFQIIDYLRKQMRHSPQLVKGIGDDCAVADIPDGEQLLITTDLLAESIHFRLDWTDLFHLGRKSVSVNVSDLAAMGATPRFLFLSLAVPDKLEHDALEQFFSGFLQACIEYGAVLAGGDTCRSADGLTISVTALGTASSGHWISRSTARSGDDIYVTGTIGDSALVLQQLQVGKEADSSLRQRHIDPTARVAAGRALAADKIATAMIDISDGLLGDLEHILAESQVGAVIEESSLPLSDLFRSELGRDAQLIDCALTGGEDYELLFTAAPGREAEIADLAETTGVPISKIGRIVPQQSGVTLTRNGKPIELPTFKGYKHFPETP